MWTDGNRARCGRCASGVRSPRSFGFSRTSIASGIIALLKHDTERDDSANVTQSLQIPDPSTTLADLFMPFRFGDLSSAVRASLRSWLNDEIDDGLAHGRQARLRRWTVDSFFSVPLVRDGDTGGMRKRSWS